MFYDAPPLYKRRAQKNRNDHFLMRFKIICYVYVFLCRVDNLVTAIVSVIITSAAIILFLKIKTLKKWIWPSLPKIDVFVDLVSILRLFFKSF